MGEIKKEEVKDNGDTKSSNNTAEQKSFKDGSSASNFSLSDSELTFSDSELSKELIEDIACRESIRLLMGNIEEKQVGIKNSKNLIRDIDKELKDYIDIVKNLEGKMQEKKNDYERCLIQEKILKSNIDDLDSELNELFIFSDNKLYEHKMHQMKKTLIENSGIFGVLKKKIETLKEQSNEFTIIFNGKTKELKILADELMMLKEKNCKLKGSQYHDNNINVNVGGISKKYINHEAFNEIKLIISENIQNSLNSETNFLDYKIRQSLKNIQSINSKAESRICELKRDYEMKKSEILENVKHLKENLITIIKKNNDNVCTRLYEESAIEKEQLRQNLKQAREQEHKFHCNSTELDKIYQKFIVFIT